MSDAAHTMKAAHAAWAKRFAPGVYQEGRQMGMYAGDEGLTQDDADWRPPEDPAFNPEPDDDGQEDDDESKVTMQSFIDANRSTIEGTIRMQDGCENLGPLDDDDLEDWIGNFEPLYTWARLAGVDV